MELSQRRPPTRQLTHQLHEYMSRYGYEVIELPIIEAADLFLIKAGDQIVNRLFTFDRHGQQYALRPEFTAAAAFRYIQSHTQSVVRWQFSGPIFEDDPNDAERSYQRLSLGAELIGMAGATAEAEIIGMAAQGLTQMDINGWHIHMGHMRLLRQVIARFGLDSRTERFILHQIPVLCAPAQGKPVVLEQLNRLIGKVSESPSDTVFEALLDTSQNAETFGGRTHQDITRRLLQKRQRAVDRDQMIRAIDALARWCAIDLPPDRAFVVMNELADNAALQRTLADWKAVIELLEAYQISSQQITIRPGLARSWEYYTGIVFDLATADGTVLGGGGRYDELARLIGGEQDVPAFGFAYYHDAMLAAVPETDEHRLQLTLTVSPTNATAAAGWAHQLRQKGFTVQLLPSEQLSTSFVSLMIDDRGYAIQNNKVYTLTDIDALSLELERVNL